MNFPLSPAEAAWCALAIAAGYAVRAVSGFGAGVIATPLLTFVLPLPVTVPLITVIGMFAGSRQVVRDWRAIDWARIARFVPGSLVGVALGLYLFASVDQALLARALGGYILLYALHSLFGAKLWGRDLPMPRWMVHPLSVVGGLVATIFGGLAGAIYATWLDAQKLAKSVFRVTMSAALLLLGLVRSIGYAATGVFGPDDFVLIGAALLPAAVGTVIGDRLHDRLDPSSFRRAVGVLLVASGAGLLLLH
ncbi:MAG: sulfite exporter TauE/SafE family protein [Burkholderiales bacterium]